MRAARIEATNIHGHLDYAVDLQPSCWIIGPNESGKSSLLGMPELVVTGPRGSSYPVLGASPGYPWSAGLIFDDGTRVQRWYDSSHQLAINGEPGRTITATQKAVLRRVGTAATWSISAFLSLSANKQLAEFEASILTGGGWSRDTAIERLAPHLKEIRGLLGKGAKWLPGGESGREVVATVLGLLTDADRAADANVQRLRKAMQQHDREQRAEDRPPGTVASWRAHVERMDKEIASNERLLGQHLGEHTSRVELEAALATRHQDLQDASIVADSQPETTKAVAKIIKATQARRETAHQALVKHVLATAAAKQTFDALVAARAAATATAPDAEAHTALDRLAALPGADATDVAIVRQKLPLRDEERAAVTAAFDDDIAASEVKIEAMGRTTKRHEALVKALDSELSVAAGRKERAQQAQAAKKTAQQQRKQLEKEIATMTKAIEALQAPALTAIEERLVELREERAEAQANADTLSDAVGAEARRMERQQASNVAVAERTSIRARLRTLKTMQGEVLAELVRPVEDRMDVITLPSMGVRVSLDTSSGLHMHLVRDDQVVPFETASESQRAIVALALYVAANSDRDGWRHIEADNLEHLDGERRTDFARAVEAAIAAGMLDNFVGACVDDGWRPPATSQTLEHPFTHQGAST